MTKSLRTKAIVLRRTNYGEADRILNFITPEGRYSAIARGVRREKSRLAGGIELFAISDIVVAQGKGELGIVTSARLIVFFRHILEEYDRLQFAYEAIKQVARASETSDDPQWFTVISEVLAALDDKNLPLELVETWFYLHYAEILGHGLNLRRDAADFALSSDKKYVYDTSDQALRESKGGDITADHIKLLRLASAKSLSVLGQISGVEPILPVCLLTTRQHAGI